MDTYTFSYTREYKILRNSLMFKSLKLSQDGNKNKNIIGLSGYKKETLLKIQSRRYFLHDEGGIKC